MKIAEGPKPFARAWEAYNERVVPKSAGVIQRSETRTAFYAGALALLGMMMDALGEDDEPTDDEIASLDALRGELGSFVAELAVAKAAKQGG